MNSNVTDDKSDLEKSEAERKRRIEDRKKVLDRQIEAEELRMQSVKLPPARSETGKIASRDFKLGMVGSFGSGKISRLRNERKELDKKE